MEKLDSSEINVKEFEDYLFLIEDLNRDAVGCFLSSFDNYDRVMTSPGSRGAHHAWKGGYKEHIRQTMQFIYNIWQDPATEKALEKMQPKYQFTLSDALTVMFLHDIEKPFMYKFNEDETISKKEMSKEERKAFRDKIIDEYGFVLTDTMRNALLYVEGVPDSDYRPGERVDHPLAALCHAADNYSARFLYDFGRPAGSESGHSTGL